MDRTIIGRDRFISRAVIGSILLLSVTTAVLLIMNMPTPAILLIAVPVIFMFISSCRMVNYLYLFCFFISVRLVQNPSFLLSDAVVLVVLGAFVVRFLLQGTTEIKYPSIGNNYLYLILALILVSVFSYDPVYAITPFLRVLIQLATIIAIYNMIDSSTAVKLIKFYFWVAVCHSAYNLFYFIQSSGTDRIFGYAGVYFDDLAMLAFPIGLACFLWSASSKRAFIYGLGAGLTLFGMMATQSRAPLATPVWVGMIILIYSAYRAIKTEQRFVIRRMKQLAIASLSITALIFFSGIADSVTARFERLPEMSAGTVWLRMSLWRTSLTSFYENPLTGIGPGSFRFIELIVPGLKFDIARLYLTGASAHNLFLHYLAETGLIGTFALLALLFKNLRNAIRLTGRSKNNDSMAISVGLTGVALSILGSIFYMDGWMWGQNAHVMPFFIAVIARLLVDSGKPDNWPVRVN